MHRLTIVLLTGVLGTAPFTLQAENTPSPSGYGPGMMGPGYARGIGPGMTDEQRQQHWEQMQQLREQRGMPVGPQGRPGPMTDEQRQQRWEQIQQLREQRGMPASPQGGPGPMTDEQRQQRWEQMQQLRQEHGMQAMPYPGYGRQMSPEQRQQHWQEMQERREQHGMPQAQPGSGWRW